MLLECLVSPVLEEFGLKAVRADQIDNGNYKRILMNAPHNRLFNEKSIGAARAYDWDTVYRLISEYACEKYTYKIVKEAV